MRDKRFVAEHRGGPLRKEQQRQLITWASNCEEHVVPLFDGKLDNRLKNALLVAKEWEQGTASVGDARNAAFGIIALAKEVTNPTSLAIAIRNQRACPDSEECKNDWGLIHTPENDLPTALLGFFEQSCIGVERNRMLKALQKGNVSVRISHADTVCKSQIMRFDEVRRCQRTLLMFTNK